MFAEVIFEPGAHSVLQVDSEEELKSFLTEHQRRAINGEKGGPTGHNAERIYKVLLYEDDPVEMHSDRVDASKVSELVSGMSKNGTVDPQQLIRALRDEVSPVYPVDQGKRESYFKAKESGELDLSFLRELGS